MEVDKSGDFANFLEISNFNNEEFLKAVTKGKSAIVSLMIEKNLVDPSIENNKAIRDASAKGHYKIVAQLVKDKRVDPTASNNEALEEAQKHGHEAIVELFESLSINNRKAKKRKTHY